METTTPVNASASAPRPSSGKLLRRLHLLVGLSVGALFVVIGLSGSILLWRTELEGLLYPQLTHSTSSGPVDFDRCFAAASAYDPAQPVHMLRISTRADATFEWSIWPKGPDGKKLTKIVYMDPHTCVVLGTRGPKLDVMSWLVQFHHTLLSPVVGPWLQLATAVGVLFLAISGILQWWPATWSWGRVKPRASARPLHYSIGFWASCFFVLIALSGAYMAWKSTVDKALIHDPVAMGTDGQSAPGRSPRTGETPVRGGKKPLSMNAIVAAVLAAQREAQVKRITIPGKETDPIPVQYRLPDEHGRANENQAFVRIGVDGTPRVTVTMETHDASAMRKLLTMLEGIHFGEIAGMASRLIWTLLGICPAVLFGSGWLIWRRRIHAERRGVQARVIKESREGV
jgi:uncharacterized iron-regulated membrane protein